MIQPTIKTAKADAVATYKLSAGKATLTFSAVYEGQGVEANGQPKARDLKLTMVIAR
ncbi:MAG: hypothetical protein LBI54_08960 [Lachnospiraceae bacterium]|nr:hypothetical protein [Lachnospiraceae bacterium]